MNKLHSLRAATEKSGDFFTLDEINVIAHRIQFVKKNIAPNANIIDVGAGDGILPSILAVNSNQYVAIDLVPENISSISKIDSVFPLISDAHFLPLKDNSADYVICMAAIYYLDLNIFLSEVFRVLKPSGKFLFCTSNPEVATFCPAADTLKYYNIKELNEILNKYDFNPIFYGAFSSFIKYNFISKIFVYIRNKLKPLTSNIILSRFWFYFRIKYYGGSAQLNYNFLNEIINSNKFSEEVIIKNMYSNISHRVLYCNATVRK